MMMMDTIITRTLYRQVTEHLCGELLRHSDNAGFIAADMGEAGIYRKEDQQVEFDGCTLSYNVAVSIHSLVWDMETEGERGIATRTVYFLKSVNYDVSIDGVAVWDNETGSEFCLPDGLLAFLRDGLSGTWESDL